MEPVRGPKTAKSTVREHSDQLSTVRALAQDGSMNMAKTRLKSKFLTDRPLSPPGSYKNTLVWRWLQEVITTNDDVGLAIRVLRKRIDMPNQFPHMTYLQQYLRKARLDEKVVQRVYRHMWNMYAEYRDLTLHNVQPGTRNPWDNSGVHDMPEPVAGSSRFLSR